MLFSGIPSQLGLFRFLAKMNPASVGLTPAFNVGIKDGYTFETKVFYYPETWLKQLFKVH